MFRRLYQIAKSVFSDQNSVETSSARRFRFESLEEKAMLTKLIDFDPSLGVITVEGDAANDTALVYDDAGRVVVNLDGFGERSFSRQDVNRIDFFGRGGNDIFRSSSVVPVKAFGGNGDDSLTGGLGDDVLNGGNGVDRLFGNLGNDSLIGGDGNDQLFGGDGNDRLRGDRGDDRLSGQGGDDTLLGGAQNDFMHGDGGNDRLFGNAGDDEMFGDNGNDRLVGHSGNDILHGGFDNDVLFGGADDDILNGDQGNDRLNGQQGNDTANGGDGNDVLSLGDGHDIGNGDQGDDRLLGGDGNDTLNGDAGNDVIIGDAGSDDLSGGHGNDFLRGVTGNDILRGDAGKDVLRGEDGNDSLYGGPGKDRLFGGSGQDGMFGGIDNVADRLLGQADEDRYLFREKDRLDDRFANSEAIIHFEDSVSGTWTDAEVEAVDGGLRLLHFRTENTALLNDTISDRPMIFVKVASLAGGANGQNDLIVEKERFFSQENLRWEQRVVTTRQISFADWDESIAAENEARTSSTIHLVAKNYDSIEEILKVDNEANQRWRNYLQVSNWTDQFPNDPINYQISRDGTWWYTNDSSFFDLVGTNNPSDDWSTTWEHYFLNARTSGDAELNEKLFLVDDLFNSMFER